MYYFYFYLISLSIIGYGYLISLFLNLKNKEFGQLGILGLIFLAFISYISSLFVSHNTNFNLSILIFGILSFIYFFEKNNKFEILKFLIVFTLLIIFILVAKNHDDFGYYHFPYAIFLTEFSHPVGFGQFNNGFRSPSSIFFISSLFYLPKISFYLIHIVPALILGFSNLILINKIFSKENFKKNLITNFLSLITLVFINIFFYRLAEHGTDRSGMILIMISIIYLLNAVSSNQRKETIENIKFSIVCICFIVTIKPFYLIYLPLILIFFLFEKTYKIFYDLLFTKVSLFCFFLVFLTFFFTFINSGCLVFPVTFTCFDNLSWTIDYEEVEGVKKWFELWSKAGATPNMIIDNKDDYIKNFNWLSNWINIYFFNKVSDFILGVIFLSTIFLIYFYQKKNVFIIKKNFFYIYFFLILIFIEWFINHPTLRYGGYHLIALLFFLPICNFVSNTEISRNIFIKKATLLILVTIIIFLSRNLTRLNKEYSLYNYNPFYEPRFTFIGGDKKFYFRYNDIMRKNLSNYEKINILGKSVVIINKKSKKDAN